MSLVRNVLAGAGIITVAGVLSRLLSLLSVPILSRLLGPEPYGVAALLGTVVALAATLALMGIDMAYARFFLQIEGADKDSIEGFCWRHACASAAAIAGALGVGWALLGGRWVGAGHEWLSVFLVLATLLSVLTTMATTRMRIAGRYGLLAGALVAAALVTMVVNIGLAWAGVLNEWALLGGVLAGSVTTLAILKLPGRQVLLRPSGLDAQTRRTVLFLALAGSVTAPMHWVISSSDRWFLASFVDNATVGIYAMVGNFVSVALLLNSSLTLTWFPEASRVYEQRSEDTLKELGTLSAQLVVVLGLVWVAVCAAGGGIVRILTAQEFHSGTGLIPWLAGGIFFYGVATLATTPFFLENRMRTVALVWVLGAVLSVTANLVLTPRLGAKGAAMAQCLSFAAIALYLVALGRRVLHLPVQWLRLGLSLTLAFVAGLAMSPPWAAVPAWDLAAKLPMFVLAAAGLIGVIAPQWLKWAQAVALRPWQSEVR